MKRGFTLFETMVAVALLAILLAVAATPPGARTRLGVEGDFGWALITGERHLDRLRGAPFNALPPRLLRVKAGGRVELGELELAPGSLRVCRATPGYPEVQAREDGSRGRYRVDAGLAGSLVLVDYQELLPDLREAHTASTGSPPAVRLENRPVLRVARVELARGDEFLPLSGWSLGQDGRLRLPSTAAGKVVVVTYWGARIRHALSGRFVDDRLRDLDRPSPIKRILLEERYGGGSFGLELLKTGP